MSISRAFSAQNRIFSSWGKGGMTVVCMSLYAAFSHASVKILTFVSIVPSIRPPSDYRGDRPSGRLGSATISSDLRVFAKAMAPASRPCNCANPAKFTRTSAEWA